METVSIQPSAVSVQPERTGPRPGPTWACDDQRTPNAHPGCIVSAIVKQVFPPIVQPAWQQDAPHAWVFSQWGDIGMA